MTRLSTGSGRGRALTEAHDVMPPGYAVHDISLKPATVHTVDGPDEPTCLPPQLVDVISPANRLAGGLTRNKRWIAFEPVDEMGFDSLDEGRTTRAGTENATHATKREGEETCSRGGRVWLWADDGWK